MAAQHTFSAITHRAIPQLLKPRLQDTTFVHDRRHKWSVTIQDPLKWYSNPNKSLCKCMDRPRSLQEPMQDDIVVKQAKLVEVVRELITNDNNGVKFDDLLMVDALERLGLDYHYEDEINQILEQCNLQFINKDFIEYRNLYEGKNGKFMESLKYDIKGLIELYEASQLCIEGENILDEATIFSSHMLQKALDFLDDKKARLVRYTLENPHRRNITYFTLLNSPKDSDATILKDLAELEYTMVQSIRKMEINEILRWWKDLGLEQELNLVRNQPLKWYIVPMICLTNPTLSQQRVDFTKIVSLIYIIDDIFDIYGTLNELTLLTEAINMWDTNIIEQLPYYIKSSFLAWATLCDAFLVEAKWFASGHIPKSEEYLKNGIVSSGVQVFLVHMFFLLGDGANKESANLIDNNHEIVSSVSKILRLSDDLESEEDENQDGHDGSYVKCFMMEHEYSSAKTAREYVKKMISDVWKCLNKECLSPSPFSENFLKGSLNLARFVPSMYSYSHNNSFDLVEEYIRSIL
ncbi:hypothetical protein L1987_86363 [Smallanthus sonchifolius]|uniref:Uncharacterized protein n=1 Tax=Smallanthus sonchifolius TaxID=185202 RepID=A0ACB8Y0B1_9ASTR|nr:hypothetical protein L1987_86363 [Smallanthus sonchifolius]